jgi:hypothetical protein
VDCGKESHPFTPAIWLFWDFVLPFLCLPCLGRRIGRPIGPWDFKPDSPANAWMIWRDHKLARPYDASTAWAVLRAVSDVRGGLHGVNRAVVVETIQRIYHEHYGVFEAAAKTRKKAAQL